MNNHESQPARLVAGRYEIRKSLGRGGFSEVWLAYDRQLEREVALKQLFGSVEDETFRKQREREIRIHSQLTSKHVISLFDSFIHEKHLYLVLELMDKSLADFMDPLDPNLALLYASECLQGLRALHSRNVIHRDLKPANIFLDQDGQIRLGDFGAAQAGGSMSLAAWSPKYIAPELALGSPEQEKGASDLYSLGMVLYELILGAEGMRLAFPDVYAAGGRDEAINHRWLLWHNNMERPAPRLSDFKPEISTEISDWVCKLVEKDITARLSSAAEALAAMPGGVVDKRESSNSAVPVRQTPSVAARRVAPFGRKVAFFLVPVAVILVVISIIFWGGEEATTATLIVSPDDREGINVFWNRHEAASTKIGMYELAPPLDSGRLMVRIDSIVLIDTLITVRPGDTLRLQLKVQIAHMDSLVQVSSFTMVTFVLNAKGSVKIEGVGEQQGDSVTFNLPHGEYSYKVTAPQFEQEQGSMVLEGSKGKRFAIDLKAKAKRRVKKPIPAIVKASGNTFIKTIGGLFNDVVYDVVLTSDGGYVFAGYTRSKGSGDAWLIKTDKRGYVKWERTYAGSGFDLVFGVSATHDGGYVMAGSKESKGSRNKDAWLIKTNSQGKKEWDRTYGGSAGDVARSVYATSDGGYVLAGYTNSKGAGSNDAWLIKTDKQGKLLWDRTYGGSQTDHAEDVLIAPDGGYLVVGYTASKGAGSFDAWLIKTDRLGRVRWDRTYGESHDEIGRSVSPTPDGGYVVAGMTKSKGAGHWDAWLFKTNRLGIMQWDQAYGGSQTDEARSASRTPDGGYMVAGYTQSKGAGSSDAWLIKTDRSGRIQWTRTFGGSHADFANKMYITPDGGYVIAGMTWSQGAGSWDAWLIKTDALGRVEE